jgi:uncharacterized protein
MIDFDAVAGFDWDQGNERKSVEKHAVSQSEAEEAFLNRPIMAMPDHRHSGTEVRFHLLGVTNHNRRLHIAFTLRGDGALIRVISARDMNQKERRAYEEANERTARIQK